MTILIRRPNAIGDETNISYQVPGSTYHWDKVDDITHDAFATYVYHDFTGTWKRDFYHIQPMGVVSEINWVKIHCWLVRPLVANKAKIAIKTHGTVYESSEIILLGFQDWYEYTYELLINPYTLLPWTVAEVDDLQIGMNLFNDAASEMTVCCTMIYAAVDCPINIEWTKSISDIITISDAISKAASVHKVDAIAIADAISKAIGVSKSDTIAISDSKSHLKSGIGFHNAVAQKRYKAATFSTFTFPDPAGIGFTSANDGYYMIAGYSATAGSIKEIGINRTETMAILDAITTKAIGLGKVDSITIADVFTKASEFYRDMADTISIADSFSKTSEFYRSMADTVVISDSAGKAIGISKADLITITEAISKAVGTNKVDTLAIVDIEVKTIGKNLVDLIIITDGFEPIGALFVPPGIYIIEIHDSDGSLVAILEKAYNISLETKTNAPALLTFSIPSDESKLSYLTRARELWVRDYDNKTVIAKTKLLRKEDVRD